jgi:phosphoserine aminotransferase
MLGCVNVLFECSGTVLMVCWAWHRPLLCCTGSKILTPSAELKCAAGSTSKIHNFSAGPCILPQEVIEQSAAAIREFDGMGLSLIEISHRSKNFERVMDEARQLVKDILNLEQRYEVLFLQGGATLGFYTAALNYLKPGGKAAYANTGVWAAAAIKEAQLVGDVDVIADSSDKNHSYIPSFEVPAGYDYFHFTSNNTIYGTQYQSYPKCDVPMVCDMSSDIFSKLGFEAKAEVILFKLA